MYTCCYYLVAKSCLILCNSTDYIMPGFPVLHYLLEFAQTHVCWIDDTIQPFYPLLPPSPPALNLSQHQGPFQWVSSSHQVVKVLELQIQHQSFPMNIEGWFPSGLISRSPCSLRGSQESSPAPQIESINSSVLHVCINKCTHIQDIYK